MALRTWRMMFDTSELVMFFAPKNASGSERTAPMMVPSQAIWTYSIM